MKFVLIILGLALIAAAVVYVALPADHLPAFFPGHAAGVTRMHYKHAVVSAVAGVILLAIGWFMGRR